MKFFNALVKWVLVIIAGLSAALLAIIFLSGNAGINPFMLRLVLLAAIGFIGGLAGRVFFSKASAFLTFLMVLVASLISLLLIDLFYETPNQLNIVASNFDIAKFSISDGGQIFFLSLVSLPPLLFMRRRTKRKGIPQTRQPRRQRVSLTESIKPVLDQINPANWQVFKPKPKSKKLKTSASKPAVAAQPKTSSKTRVNRPTSSSPTLTISRPASQTKQGAKIKPNNGRKSSKVKSTARKLKIPAKLFGGNGSDVKLVGEEEHVCPYCLEEVVRGDPQGIVVCPECGTWHHQDCWNLTGSCGVAHRNEL